MFQTLSFLKSNCCLTELEVTSNRSTNSLKSSQIINKSISIEKKTENKLTTPRSENKLHKMKSPKKVFHFFGNCIY